MRRRRDISTLLWRNISALLSSIRLSVRRLAVLLRSVSARLGLIRYVCLHDDDLLLPSPGSKAAPDTHAEENRNNNVATWFNVALSAEGDDGNHIDNPDYSKDDFAGNATTVTRLTI